MCLYLQNNNSVPGVAETDIKVYKFGTVYKQKLLGLTWEYFRPYFRSSFRYTKNHRQPKVKLIPSRKLCYMFNIIEKGYHAWVTPPKTGETVGIFIIPKGTKYFLGNDNDIVAETLIYTGEYV